MNLETMKLCDLKKLVNLFDCNEKTSPVEEDCGIRIVILQRGWVMIGRYKKNGSRVFLLDGFNIRKWGTTKGLGQLATDGPASETVLDPVPEVSFHELTEIATLQCTRSAWAKHFK